MGSTNLGKIKLNWYEEKAKEVITQNLLNPKEILDDEECQYLHGRLFESRSYWMMETKNKDRNTIRNIVNRSCIKVINATTGKTLLNTYGFSRMFISSCNRRGIYTLNDLLKHGEFGFEHDIIEELLKCKNIEKDNIFSKIKKIFN